MLEVVYSTARALQRVRRSWLKEFISNYLSSLAAQRYKKSTLRSDANQLLCFGEFLEQQGVCGITQLPEWINPFIRQFHLREPDAGNWRSTLTRFAHYLVQEGVLPAPQPGTPICPHAQLVAAYAQSLQEQRGICHQRVHNVQRCCESLLLHLGTQGVDELDTLGPEHIHSFIIKEGRRCGRITLRSRCTMLRGFLTYLYRQGITADLASAVVAPRVYRHEQCPRFLTRAEVLAVLAAVDRQTTQGRRDYAMLLLLAVYGLRGIEVIRLQLDDIDWRSQSLSIRARKAGNHTAYPLAVSVGEAIISYLKNGRPPSTHREVFLSTVAPFGPLAAPTPLGTQVRKYLTKAGVVVERPGTHTFRYSCAQRLLEEGAPLKSISDYLGHGDIRSTQRYTKMAIDQLREVAVGGGEDLL